jgi:hypothetical protein
MIEGHDLNSIENMMIAQNPSTHLIVSLDPMGNVNSDKLDEMQKIKEASTQCEPNELCRKGLSLRRECMLYINGLIDSNGEANSKK